MMHVSFISFSSFLTAHLVPPSLLKLQGERRRRDGPAGGVSAPVTSRDGGEVTVTQPGTPPSQTPLVYQKSWQISNFCSVFFSFFTDSSE